VEDTVRQAAKKDSNHHEVAYVFQCFGFDTIDTSGYSGKMLDLLVTLGNGYFQYIEIKDGNKPPSQRKLTRDGQLFISKRPDKCTTIESVEQAKNFCACVIAERKF
jgi:hypothetical protein